MLIVAMLSLMSSLVNKMCPEKVGQRNIFSGLFRFTQVKLIMVAEVFQLHELAEIRPGNEASQQHIER